MRLLPVLLTLLLAAVSSAQEQIMRQVYDTKTDTHVEVTALFTKPSASGHFPLRIKAANNQKRDHRIRLTCKSNSSYRSGTTSRTEFVIDAPGEKLTTRDILVPLNPAADTYQANVYLEIQLDGTMGSQTHNVSADYGSGQPSVLLSEPLFSLNASMLDSEAAARISGFAGGSFTSRFDAAQLPDNWLAFSGFDSIVMLDSDWTSMPAGSRNAILSWLRLGGNLLIYGTNPESQASLGIPYDISYGNVAIQHIPSSLALNPADVVAYLTTGNPLNTHRYGVVGDYKAGWSLFMAFPDKAFRYVIFVIVLLLFGILVGPVNLFVFAKSGRRHLLFITTPIIALGASLLLIALILFQDGFGGDGSRVALMDVPAGTGENAAFIHQEQVSRTGVLTRSNFTMETPAFLSPVPMEDNRWTRFNSRDTDGNYSIQPAGSGQDLSGDWFQSRSMQGQILAAVVPTRGRIERAGGSGQMLSTFDFPIEKLFYQDVGGQWFRAEAVETGKPFTLTPLDVSLVTPELDKLESELSRRNALLFDRARERKGHFVALSTAAPGVATHPGIRWNTTRTIITGGIATP